MSSYKLTAIYKQKIRCRLRNSNCPTFCLCQYCWVARKPKKFINSQNSNMRNISKPPPPPLPNLNESFNQRGFTRPLTFSDQVVDGNSNDVSKHTHEVRRLWSNRDGLSSENDSIDVPADFVFVHLDPILQIGPNCGLAALAMASTATATPVSTIELFRRAKERGFTIQGEMFSAENMASLAQTVLRPWFKVELISGGLDNTHVLDCLSKGALMLVPYDASGNYSPCCKNGHKSHWAVVCGAANAGSGQLDECFVFVRQGKSKRLLLWPLKELQISNDNLVEFDPKRAADGSHYVLPEGGVQSGLKGRAIILHLLNKTPDLTSFP
ncbi:hypothetical protein LSTR_LSTR003572 [Laodelphax striatellus]|uniref:Actin maturation protease n=1 Tax=Laodelphax striatellus TaxID=195883 RepID=A0A482WLR7_LAOST|nr:hypothetical protein LSTR_LSTR003572 [Laodelphax striatellus]